MGLRKILWLALLAWGGGCSTERCKPGTVLVTYSLPAGAESADTIDVTLAIGNAPAQTKSFQRKANARSIEIDFGSYPAGQSLTLTLTARAGDQLLASATQTVTASAGCTLMSATVVAANGNESDLGVADLAVSGPGLDLSAARDLGMSDLTTVDLLSASQADGPSCTGDNDCAGALPRCDTGAGVCVACLPVQDNCPAGNVCVDYNGSYRCVLGCGGDDDCRGDGGVDGGADGGTAACCSHACVDTRDEAANCGACGHACGLGESCCGGGCVNFSNDQMNCGGCGIVCGLQSNAAGFTCSNGHCEVNGCAFGYEDCNHTYSDGCEDKLTNSNGQTNSLGNPNQIQFCGACGGTCPLPAQASGDQCAGGSCAVTSCNSGYKDCDNSFANGCEANLLTSDGQINTTGNPSVIDHCGSCSGTCPLTAQATADVCSAGLCQVSSCSGTHRDCNGTYGDGCELDIANSDGQVNNSGTPNAITHCGSCSGTCAIPSQAASTSCASSACAVTSCNSGYKDCDNSFTNGCEANLSTSDGQTNTTANPAVINHCGTCSGTCPLTSLAIADVCSAGLCQVSSCSGTHHDCNGIYSDGCELDIGNSDGQVNNSSTPNAITHCGSCTGTCALVTGVTSASCASSKCKVTGCSNTSFGDCNGTFSDGCEANLTNSDGQVNGAINHCGACGTTCPFKSNVNGTSCTSSACTITSCQTGFANCNTTYSDGCEVNTNTDRNNCGGCGIPCGSQYCISGVCTNVKRVFLSSAIYNGNMGGLTGADANCQALANAQSLGGTWKAWLSSSTVSVASRFAQFAGPYVRLDGVVIANSWTDLTSGSIRAPINKTETGASSSGGSEDYCANSYIGAQVWTATTTSGTIGGFSQIDTCGSWTSSAAKQGLSCSTGVPCGATGTLGSASSTWTDSACGEGDCSLTAPIYCFEQ